ncbi:MAG: transcription termination factor Rho [Candidatus Sumerlaeota bacterium]|nr:transcription termination factor Rho [Candidatus Sumerlaeota bacterium]
MSEESFSGILEIYPKGFGFVRELNEILVGGPRDAYVSDETIAEENLQPGAFVEGTRGPGKKGYQLKELVSVNGLRNGKWRRVPRFQTLTAIDPREHLVLEHPEASRSMRVLDLVCPIGKGQRGLIVAAPRTGKTVLLQQIAQSVTLNYPKVKIVVALIDERPEEVTDMRRSIHGDVFASSNDEPLENHLRLAQLTLEYAKRWVEADVDVLLLLDSLTRVGRAFNLGQPSSGRTMSGGVDSRALEIPRKIFGAARKAEEAGSLTILATALVETNSKMDDLIFEEFKGTGNMELVLNRNLANRRIWPAINIPASGTRKEELLLGDRLEAHQSIRRYLAKFSVEDALEMLLKGIEKTKTNDELLGALAGV